MSIDLNNAGNQFGDDPLIPEGVNAKLRMTIRPGGAGDGGWLKQSKSGETLQIDAQFEVLEGPYAGRKFWGTYALESSKPGSKGPGFTRGFLKAALNSAKGLDPNDDSEAARRQRVVDGIGAFDGIEFQARIGIEAGTNGYKDRNKIAWVITPDMPEYDHGWPRKDDDPTWVGGS